MPLDEVKPEAVDTVDAAPLNSKETRQPLYAGRPRIHPKRARGQFRRLKWIVMAVTLAVYYVTPWLRWDRGPFAPDQAVLIDLPARRFYFFFIEIWPQEIYYLTGLLILAAVALFLVTSIAGRVWCGYTCPQTVWTDLFIAVERAVEGDRNARIRLDKEGWSPRKFGLKIVKHVIWLLIAVGTGGAWVFYFADAPTLAVDLVRFEAPMIAYSFIGIFAFTTYALGGLAREQVCTYMCPWPRIQGAMLDSESMVVTYHPARGEPRGSHKKGESWDDRGHCVDCNQCVAVCPMGIDIRDGQQLECIGCALCIDACNDVMTKVGLPRDLISYDTLGNMERAARGQAKKFRLIRPRTVFYAAIIVVVGIVMLVTLINRQPIDINILRDRNPVYVRLSDGGVRNGYALKLLNKRHAEVIFKVALEGIPGARLRIVGVPREKSPVTVTVPPDMLRSFRALVSVPPGSFAIGTHRLVFRVTDTETGLTITDSTTFEGPNQ